MIPIHQQHLNSQQHTLSFLSTQLYRKLYPHHDPQLETLTIPILSQLQTQPQTIESTPNETELDSPNQEHIDTETHSFNPQSIQTIESTEPTPQEPAT